MNILQLVQEFCKRQQLPVPTTLFGINDDQIYQIVALCNEICEELGEQNWTMQQIETVFTSVATPVQATIASLCPYGFQKILNETIWDRSRLLPLYGPTTPERWQMMQAMPTTGPFYQYRIQGGVFEVYPTPPAGMTYAFEYLSNWLVQAEGGVVPKQLFTANTDTFRLGDSLLMAGIRWKWRQMKGLPYAEEFRRYETAVGNAKAGDGTKPILQLQGWDPTPGPGIFVPPGNWAIPNP